MAGRKAQPAKRTAVIPLLAAALLIAAPSAASAATITPTTTADQFNTDPTSCSLREAVWAANNDNAAMAPGCPPGSGADTIPLADGTYALTIPGVEDVDASGDLDLLSSITITHAGTGSAVIDGGGLDRVIDNQPAVDATSTIEGVTITNGTTTGDGGGIRANSSATLVLSNSTVNGNFAGSLGGGVRNSGPAALTNVTISGNRANASGGGLADLGSATSNNATVTGNTADADANGFSADGGGIRVSSLGTLQLHDTIVAGNTDASPPAEAPDCSGGVASLGNNLIGATAGCGFAPAGGDLLDVNALLGPLADNGGGTFTHALLAGSPAIDRGSGCAATDQRGVPRPQGAACDIGAYEYAPSNAFSFGKVKRNKRKGTATLTVIVPGPGTLVLKGKGLVKQRPAGASRQARAVAKAVSAAGKVKLKIRSKGKKKRKLNRTGRVKVKAKVTYTPTGGNPNTKAKRITLIKKR
jgi:CSLREA domain-containing protein